MKGPWKIILDTDGKTYIEDPSGERVAEVYGRLVDPNCFLIKAAPDLFEALEAFLTMCISNKDEVYKKAKMAIAKAKGK